MTPWNPDNAINEHDLEVAVRKGAVKRFYITQDPNEGFYITVRLVWRDDDIHLATRRERDKPRMFKSIGRLIEHIRLKYPKITLIQLHLLPGDEATPLDESEDEGAENPQESKTKSAA